MKFAIYNNTGEIVRIGECPDAEVGLQAGAGELVYEGEASLNDRVDCSTGALIVDGKPVRPSTEHDWDPVAAAWVGNLERAKAATAIKIEAVRDRWMRAAITFDGKNMDADTRSQDNIAKKLATIAQREVLGVPLPAELLVWRDADNVTHSFPDQATYKAWLGLLAIAIEERGTQAYAWSWAKKAALASLHTFQEVETFAADQLNYPGG